MRWQSLYLAMSSATAFSGVFNNPADPFFVDVSSLPEAFLQTCFQDVIYKCTCDHPYKGANPYAVHTSSTHSLSLPEEPQDSFSEPNTIDDLRQRADLYRSALCLSTVNADQQSHTLFCLGTAKHRIFLCTAERCDIDTAIDSYRRALQLALEDDRHRVYIIAHAGRAFHDRYGHGLSANVGDMLTSLHLLRKAALACEEAHPLKGYIRHWLWHTLKSLIILLIEAFHRLPSKSMSFLEDAVHYAEEALDLHCDNHPDRHRSLILLGNVHRLVAGHADDDASLELYIDYSRQAVMLCPVGHPWRWHSLGYLGLALCDRAKQRNNLYAMAEATEVFRESVLCAPPDSRTDALAHLADSLILGYHHSGDLNVLAEVIKFNEQALEAAPPGHSQRHQALYMLAQGLVERYKRTTQDDDALRIIQYSQEMLILTHDHPARYIGNHCLAWIYLRRTEIPNHLRLSIYHLSLMVKDYLGQIQDRLPKAMDLLLELCMCLDLTSISEHHDLRLELLQVYRYTLRLLPRKAFLGQDVEARLKSLSKCEMLATDAAVLALQCTRPDIALECLTEGRSVFWTQTLHLRASLDGVPPTMAEEMKSLSHSLEQQGYLLLEDLPVDKLRSAKALIRRQSTRFEEIVAHIRTQPGLDQFLHSPAYSTLSQAARSGPVIVLIAGRNSCQAIVIKSPDLPPVHVALKGMKTARLWYIGNRVKDKHIADRQALDSQFCNDRALLIKQSQRQSVTNWMDLLAELWDAIVLPVFKILELEVGRR
jgi:tetratricopeptide (TPR) repeat protein